jgi:hypothetical protein
MVRNISRDNMEEPTMATQKSLRVLVGILVISASILGSAMQAGAETLNYKSYIWMNKQEIVPVGDVEGHNLYLSQRGGFYVWDNGEIATITRASLNDLIKGAGPATTYETIKFADGSTIMLKGQSTLTGTAVGTPASGEYTSEIINGTGRFEGIKGTQSAKAKFLPAEKAEAGSKQYGEGTLTYTLPAK